MQAWGDRPRPSHLQFLFSDLRPSGRERSQGRWAGIEKLHPSGPGHVDPSALHRQLGPSGKRGRTSRSGMAMKTPSGRCCGSAGVCRPRTTRRSTSWPHRCSRCQAAPQALVSSSGHPSPQVCPGQQSPVLGPVGPASALSLALTSWVWEYQGPPLPPRSETGNSLKSRALGTGEDIRQLVWLWE